jgi:hypothetical protein
MTAIEQWLQQSWDRFLVRWGAMFIVMGVTGAATLLAGFIPILIASVLTVVGMESLWLIWGFAGVTSLLAVFWLSTWGQVAVLIVAMTDESPEKCLAIGWKKTDSFAWVMTLVMMAVAGGWFLLMVPGFVLSVLFVLAPVLVISDEARGLQALALSWGRVRPHFTSVAIRIFIIALAVWIPGLIPYIGWLITMLWAPVAFIALVQMGNDLRQNVLQPKSPPWLSGLVIGLSLLFLGGTVFLTMAGIKAVQTLARSMNDPGGLASRVKPETAQALIDAIANQRPDQEKMGLIKKIISEVTGRDSRAQENETQNKLNQGFP